MAHSAPDRGIYQMQKSSDETFCKAYLEEFDKGATIFNDCLSYINEKQLESLVQIAIAKLSKNDGVNENEAINDLVFHAALLNPHLEPLFKRGVNAKTYYFCKPWRGISEQIANKFTDL